MNKKNKLKKARILQATGATQLTQHLNLGPQIPSVAVSEYSDPEAFSAPGGTPHSSSHGASDENPPDYAFAFGSDVDSHIEQQHLNIQQQQAQIQNIAQASLDVQSLVNALTLANSSSSSSGLNPPNVNPTPIA